MRAKPSAVVCFVALAALCVGTEEAAAASLKQTLPFELGAATSETTLQFNPFNTDLGELTGVTLDLTSLLLGRGFISGGGEFIADTTNSEEAPFDIVGQNLVSTFGLDPFKGTELFEVILRNSRPGSDDPGSWSGSLSITYEYSVIPIPAALPLFATGIAAIAFAARRKRAQPA